MNIMNIEHISKIFGEKTIFDDASIGIQEGDKIGMWVSMAPANPRCFE